MHLVHHYRVCTVCTYYCTYICMRIYVSYLQWQGLNRGTNSIVDDHDYSSESAHILMPFTFAPSASHENLLSLTVIPSSPSWTSHAIWPVNSVAHYFFRRTETFLWTTFSLWRNFLHPPWLWVPNRLGIVHAHTTKGIANISGTLGRIRIHLVAAILTSQV